MPSAVSQEISQLQTALLYQLQRQLPQSIRLLQINESAHPDVIKSFNLNQLPAFVLVRQGAEKWRLEGVNMAEPGSVANLFKKLEGLH